MSQPIIQKPTHLSELHVPMCADSLYLFGEILVRFNSVGCYFYPGLGDSIRFYSKKGHWMFCEADNMQKEAVDPEIASWQFRDLVYDGKTDFLMGILGGYARCAYQILDPLYPGFTDTLLELLISGPILSVTKPREQKLDLTQVLAAYGCSIQFNEEQNQPILVEIPVNTQQRNELDLLLATITLTLAGVDVTRWIQQVGAVDNTSNMAQILGAISRREHHCSWDGIVATWLGLDKAKRQLEGLIAEHSFGVQTLLIFMKGMYAEKDTLDLSGRGGGFAILRATTDETRDYIPEERIHYLEAILDGLNCLAQIADQQGKPLASIALAQYAKIMLQFLTDEVEGAEERLSREDLLAYSWHKLPTDQSPDKNTVFSYMGYDGLAAIAKINFFRTSRQLFAAGQASNYLWTALWSALHQLRKALQVAYIIGLQAVSWDKSDLPGFTYVLENVVKLYLNCLREFSGALVSSSEIHDVPQTGYIHVFSGVSEEDDQMFLVIERDILLRLYASLKANGFDTSSKAHLLQLVTYLNES